MKVDLLLIVVTVLAWQSPGVVWCASFLRIGSFTLEGAPALSLAQTEQAKTALALALDVFSRVGLPKKLRALKSD